MSTSETVRIVFQLPAGDRRVVIAPANQSLMRVAVGEGIPGVIGECGGELSCGTCHLYLCAPWAERVPPPSEEELDMLEVVQDRKPESRLSCQVRLDAQLDGVEVGVPDEY